MNSDSPRSAWLASRPTGASTKPMPLAAAALASRSVVPGSMVLMSRISEPGFALAMMPSVRETTSSTTAEFGSMVTMMSDFCATSATVAAPLACSSSSSATASGLISLTVSRNPLRQRLDAIGRPIRPNPMNPTFSMRLSILFLRAAMFLRQPCPGIGVRRRRMFLERFCDGVNRCGIAVLAKPGD